MKHIKIDRENDRVKDFVRCLPVVPDGSILELGGKPVLRVLPVRRVDKGKVKAAILRRRSMSRNLNQEWADADRDLSEKASTE